MARCYYWLLLCVSTLAGLARSTHHPHNARDPRTASSASPPASSSSNVPNGAATIAVAPLLNRAIAALGGKDAINKLQGIRSHAYVYRTQTLEESITPGFADNTIATAGSQTISYDLSGSLSDISQRIDRAYMISEYWYFGRAQLQPMNVSLVVRGGPQGYGCYVKGNEGIYQDPAQLGGYTDPAYTRVLVRDATRLSPKLLLMMQANSAFTAASMITVRDVQYPSITDNSLNLTVILDPTTHLPYLIRAYEDHHIFGKSSNDFVVYNYTAVGGVQIPRRIKVYYNDQHMLLDTIYDDIEINPNFGSGYFDGIPTAQVANTELGLMPSPAMAEAEYGDAEVFENTMNMLWYGGYAGTLNNLTVIHPVPGLPKLHHLTFNDATAYRSLIAEFDDAVMVVDSPPHQSKLTIEWVRETLHRNVTHLLITHHHHDHNYGAADFVAAGATLVCPERYKYYWESIPGAKFALVTEEQPFVHRDKGMQVRCVWHEKNVHANDWMYFTWTEACPGPDSPMAISVADPWSPGLVGYEFNQFAAITYLDIARNDHVKRENLVIPIHGVPSNATDLYALTGYAYPPYKTTDFIPGGKWC